jgi:hypothetical protein
MKVRKYEVATSETITNKLKAMSITPMRAKRYATAFNCLLDVPLETLMRTGKVHKIVGTKSAYVYRVGRRDRIIFSEQDNMRVVNEAGDIEALFKSIEKST